MKKFFVIFFTILGVIGSLPFTSIGQEKVLIPIANKILEEKVKDHKIKIKELKPTLNSLETRVIIDDSIDLFLTGPINWSTQEFDFNYMINSEEVNLNGLKVPVNMDIKGSLKGNPKKIDVYGVGSAFGSGVKYNFKVLDQKINSIEAIIKDAKIKEILALLKQPPYGDGRLNLKLNVPRLDLKDPEGDAQIEITKGILNKKLLAKEFGVKLPKGDFSLDGEFNIKHKVIVGDFFLNSSLGRLKSDKVVSSIDLKKIKGDFDLKVSNLAYFSKLAKRPIKGKLSLNGKAFLDRSNKKNPKIQILANTKSFGGDTQIFYNQKLLRLKLIQIDPKKLEYKLGLPEIIKSGRATLKGEFKNIKNLKTLSGKYSLKAKGSLNRTLIKKLYKFDVISEGFFLNSIGNIDSGLLKTKIVFKNPLLSATLTKLRYSIPKEILKSSFYLKVANLKNLKPLIKADLNGPFVTSGGLIYNIRKNRFKVVGASKSLGGVLKYHYFKNGVDLKLSKIDGVKLLRFLAQKPYFKSSIISGAVNLQDLKKLTGVFNLKSTGKLNKATLAKENKIKLDSDLGYKMHFKGNIISNKLASTLNLSTAIANLILSPFNIDLKSKKIIGEYTLKIPELLRLKSLLEQKYYGSLNLKGQFWKDKIFHITGEGAKWQGRIGFNLNGDNLKANVKGAQMTEIFKTLGYKPLLIGKSDAWLKYNLKSKSGKAKINIDKSKLVRNSLVKALDLVIHKDLSKEIFNNAVLNSDLSKTQIKFNFDMRSNKHRVYIPEGKIDRKKSKIDAIVAIYDGPKVYKAKLKGNLKKPKIILILTNDLKQRAIKEAEHLLKKNGIKVDKIKKKLDKVIPKDLQKSLLKGLF